MVEQFFTSPLRVQALRNGPSGSLLDGFAQELWEAGYAQSTARARIRAAEHLIYWANKEGIPSGSLNKQLIPRFDDHVSRCQCPAFSHTDRFDLLRGVRSFVGYICSADVSLTRAAEPAEEPVLLTAFYTWMRQQRGTSDRSLFKYNIPLRDLLKRIGEDPGRLDAEGLRQVVLERSQKCGWATAKRYTTALRMFLRFLIAEGKCATGLDAAIPVVAHWRLSSLPRYLQAEEVERVIAACDPASPVGRRDRAILLLLARLGLRAGDIVQLRLADIDWKAACVSVSGKSANETRLPLTQEVGQAVVDYLQDGRPQAGSDALFLRSQAPFRAFANHAAVTMIAKQAMRRAGVTCPSGGAAHVLRHSVATSMLRQGASLQDIAAILRHRSIQTTQIYAKVDVTALHKIAQPWPGVQPC